MSTGRFRCWLKRNVSKSETPYKQSETYISAGKVMQKPLFALIIVLLSVSIVGLVLFSVALYDGGSNGRGHMIQDSGILSSTNLAWLLLFVVPLVAALAVIVYLIAFPPIKQAKAAVEPSQTTVLPQTPHNKQTLVAVLKVLTEDERKVVETIASSETGSMLQKEIRWKTGLSRVKIHRVVARLAERGIVQVEKQDNTNKVTLSDWITK
jgi:uncharacterized membrane protein